MGYIDENLMNGEQVVYRSKKHWFIYYGPIVSLFLAFICLSAGKAGAALGSFLFMVSIVWGIFAFISTKTSEFGVTNKRVLIKVGLLRRTSIETLLTKVEGIKVDQDIFGRLFNYGTISINGTGGTSSPFKMIEAPMEFRKKVQEQIASIQ